MTISDGFTWAEYISFLHLWCEYNRNTDSWQQKNWNFCTGNHSDSRTFARPIAFEFGQYIHEDGGTYDESFSYRALLQNVKNNSNTTEGIPNEICFVCMQILGGGEHLWTITNLGHFYDLSITTHHIWGSHMAHDCLGMYNTTVHPERALDHPGSSGSSYVQGLARPDSSMEGRDYRPWLC